MKNRIISVIVASVVVASTVSTQNVYAADTPSKDASTESPVAVNANLPKVDDKEADMSKPIKVFVILGQSNAVGLGAIGKYRANVIRTLEQDVKEDKQYQFLLDDAGNWAERKDVRNVFLITGGIDCNDTSELHNEWMKIGAGSASKSANFKHGIEFSAGHMLGNHYQEGVMVLKCCNGNRGLGFELLPPGSKQYDFLVKDGKTGKEEMYTFAGYHDSPMKWLKGSTPVPATVKGHAFAGSQYDGDIGNAKNVLTKELDKYYPGAKGYEVAGFFFWQGEYDNQPGLKERYEENLVNFIKSVRKDLNAPNAKFVIGTLGEHAKDSDSGVFKGHMAVDGNSGKYPEFKGNVATVYTHPMARGGSGNGHYGGDSRVYMDVGLAMGQAMLDLLGKKQK